MHKHDEELIRSSINILPSDISVLNTSKIPFVLNVVPENYCNANVPVFEGIIHRCIKCKAYLNPFVEIISPGSQWKCNMCFGINDFEGGSGILAMEGNVTGFDPIQNSINNRNREMMCLKSNVIDIVAPSNFSIKAPTDPIFLIMIEATSHSIKNGMINTVLNCISNSIDIIPNSTGRTKIALGFFNSSFHILKKTSCVENTEFTIVSDFSELPSLFTDEFLFEPNNLQVNINQIENIFSEQMDLLSDYAGALGVASKILRSGGTILTFICSPPNYGKGAINTAKGEMRCKNQFYKERAVEMSRSSISVTIFLFHQTNTELPTLAVLPKYTGGMIFQYPNFDNLALPSKLATDYANFLEQQIGFEAVCKIRVPMDVSVKEHYGNFIVRQSSGILSFANFFPAHSITIELKLEKPILQGLTVQIAILRTHETGEKRIRVLNFVVPVSQSKEEFLFSVDSRILCQYLALKSIFHESTKTGSGNEFLVQSAKEICVIGKNFPFIQDFLMRTLAIMKSIPLRPSNFAPMDYKAFYIYLLSTQYPVLTDNLIYPSLFPLHLLSETNNIFESKTRLTLQNLDIQGMYLLDTGISFYFFVGRYCPNNVYSQLFDENLPNGPFIFERKDNDLSDKVDLLLKELRRGRFITPNYYFVRDSEENSNQLRDIFFSYFYEDAMFGLPGFAEFVKQVAL